MVCHVCLHVREDFPPLPLCVTAHAGILACKNLLWALRIAVVLHGPPREGCPASLALVGAAHWPVGTAVVVLQHNFGIGVKSATAGTMDYSNSALVLLVSVKTPSGHTHSTCAVHYKPLTDAVTCSFTDLRSPLQSQP